MMKKNSNDNLKPTMSGMLNSIGHSVRASGASLMDPYTVARYELQEYLDKYIDGYLLHDLKSISEKIPNNLHPGAAGFPMILTICAGMELLGALLRPTNKDKYSEEDGLRYFGHYWKHYLSKVNGDYAKYGEASRVLIRNGLAHLFMAKPRIGVVKSKPSLHLKQLDDHLIIDATSLYKDFEKSYLEFAKPRILDGKDGSQLASNRLNQIMAKYTIESDEKLKNLLKKAKDRLDVEPPTVS